MFGLGTTEILIIAVLILLLFGAKRLPDIGKGLGEAIREFKSVKEDIGLEEKKEKSRMKTNKNKGSFEDKLVDKVIEEIPGVKKGLELKEKANQIKKIIH